jgi:hypothetical protein
LVYIYESHTGRIKEKLTIKSLDSGKGVLPSQMLAIDLAEIGHKESVLVTWMTGLVVDVINSSAQGRANELLGHVLAIVGIRILR